ALVGVASLWQNSGLEDFISTPRMTLWLVSCFGGLEDFVNTPKDVALVGVVFCDIIVA
ncbi:2521_t:CDS:2, partial [Gigaspora rosea]